MYQIWIPMWKARFNAVVIRGLSAQAEGRTLQLQTAISRHNLYHHCGLRTAICYYTP